MIDEKKVINKCGGWALYLKDNSPENRQKYAHVLQQHIWPKNGGGWEEPIIDEEGALFVNKYVPVGYSDTLGWTSWIYPIKTPFGVIEGDLLYLEEALFTKWLYEHDETAHKQWDWLAGQQLLGRVHKPFSGLLAEAFEEYRESLRYWRKRFPDSLGYPDPEQITLESRGLL